MHTLHTVPEQKLLLLMVLAERPELLWLNSLLSSSEKGDSEAGDTLCCCWGRWGRRIKRGIRLRESSFSWCCALCSFSNGTSKRKQKEICFPLWAPVCSFWAQFLRNHISEEWIFPEPSLCQLRKWSPKLFHWANPSNLPKSTSLSKDAHTH